MSLGQKLMDKSNDPFRVWNDEQVFGIQGLAMAYGECAMLHFDTQFLKRLDQKEKKENYKMKEDSKELLTHLYNLATLTRIEKDLVTWLEHSYFTYDHVEMIRNEIKNIFTKIKPFIAAITDTMHPDDGLCDVMIAPANGNLY
jgi:K+-sensing histidine kinase KdpD